ncbi:hypothetical protein F4860DRAFT_260435 [Xylaria cubensis]|nr:hypothetical protein F4860DRAFT_260435 [Xylaria cubensis]
MPSTITSFELASRLLPTTLLRRARPCLSSQALSSSPLARKYWIWLDVVEYLLLLFLLRYIFHSYTSQIFDLNIVLVTLPTSVSYSIFLGSTWTIQDRRSLLPNHRLFSIVSRPSVIINSLD